MSKSKSTLSIRDFVDKLNKEDAYREQFFSGPSEFLENQTGINVGGLRDEIDSYVKKLKTATPGAKFYLPGELPSEVEELIKEYTPCLV